MSGSRAVPARTGHRDGRFTAAESKVDLQLVAQVHDPDRQGHAWATNAVRGAAAVPTFEHQCESLYDGSAEPEARCQHLRDLAVTAESRLTLFGRVAEELPDQTVGALEAGDLQRRTPTPTRRMRTSPRSRGAGYRG
jgi:hypothetical protein